MKACSLCSRRWSSKISISKIWAQEEKTNSSGDALTLSHMKAQLRGRKGSGLSNHKTFHSAAVWWRCDRSTYVWECKTPNLPFHFRASHDESYCSSCEVLEVHIHCWEKQSAFQALFPETTEFGVLLREKPKGFGLFQATQQRKQLQENDHWAWNTLNLTRAGQQWNSSHTSLVFQQWHQSTTGGLQGHRWQSDLSAQLGVRSSIQVGWL